MSRVVFTWRGDQWLTQVVPSLNRGLTHAAMVMADTAARRFGTEGGGVIGASRPPRQGGPITLRKLVRGRKRFYPAPPGRFPGVRTSNLRNSIAFASPESLGTPLHAAFGTAVKYGRFLEFGTAKMPARPWMQRVARLSMPRAQALFVRTAMSELRARGLVRRTPRG